MLNRLIRSLMQWIFFMQTISLQKITLGILLLVAVILTLLPLNTHAFYERSGLEARREHHFCRVYASRPYLTPPAYCQDEESEPEPKAPSVSLEADLIHVLAGATTTLSWQSDHTTSCAAEDGWSGQKPTSGSAVVTVNATTTYTLTCTGPGGDESDNVTVTVFSEPEPEPEPDVDHIMISEVLYDTANDGSQGTEAGGANEWVELYNPTFDPIDLMNWMIGDGSSNDVIADTSLILDPGEYLIITNSETTADFWDLSSTSVVYLGSSISGGLSNNGDSVKLYDSEVNLIDAVSYDGDVSAMDPSVAAVSNGHSIYRTDLSVDTDTEADWGDNATPSPGA